MEETTEIILTNITETENFWKAESKPADREHIVTIYIHKSQMAKPMRIAILAEC